MSVTTCATYDSFCDWCLLSLAQSDQRFYSHMCHLQLKFCHLRLKWQLLFFNFLLMRCQHHGVHSYECSSIICNELIFNFLFNFNSFIVNFSLSFCSLLIHFQLTISSHLVKSCSFLVDF